MKLGELQTLTVEKTVPFGIYLTGEDPEEGRVLLPRSQVPEGVREGDELEVFLYKDSEDRMIATRRKPKLMLHQVGYLLVGGGAVLEDSTFEVECLTGQRVVQVYLHLFFTDFYDASVETLAFFVLQGNDSVFINMLVVEVSVDAEHLAV